MHVRLFADAERTGDDDRSPLLPDKLESGGWLFSLLVHRHAFGMVVAAQLLIGIALSLYSGPGPAAIAELFATSGRSTWLSLSFSIAVAVFGGFTPFISQWLIQSTGSPLAPGFYIMAVVAMSFCVILLMRETAHRPLR